MSGAEGLELAQTGIYDAIVLRCDASRNGWI